MILEIIFLLLNAVLYGACIDTLVSEIRIKRKPVFKWDRQPVYKESASLTVFILMFLYVCVKMAGILKCLF